MFKIVIKGTAYIGIALVIDGQNEPALHQLICPGSKLACFAVANNRLSHRISNRIH